VTYATAARTLRSDDYPWGVETTELEALVELVERDWGGQAFLPHSLDKLARLRRLIGHAPALEVDGGIDVTTAGRCAAAGASLFVAGSAVFATDDPAEAVRKLAEVLGPVVRPAV